jgi:hypothetical protein
MKHEFKLLNTTETQRIYRLPRRIKFYAEGKSIVEIFEAYPIKFAKGYSLAEDLKDGIDKVCISDAHSHIERLVFTAFNVKNEATGEVYPTYRTTQIGGCMTFLIHGGDSSTVRPDIVYLRKLMMHNPIEMK